MISLALVMLSVNGEYPALYSEITGNIQTSVQMVNGRCLGSCIKIGMTGKQVKAILGKPSQIHGWNWQSGGVYYYCDLTYERLGVRVRLFTNFPKTIIWATEPHPFPEHWRVTDVRYFWSAGCSKD